MCVVGRGEERRKEGKKEGRGRERSGMRRGGGGNKSRLRTKGKKSPTAFHFFFPKVISENILSLPRVIFFSPCIFNPRHAQKHVSRVGGGLGEQRLRAGDDLA